MLGEYILSLVCASLILGIVCAFVDSKSAAGTLLRTTGGILLAITAVQPVARFDFSGVEDLLSDMHVQAQYASQAGQNMAFRETAEIIKSRCEAYILDKALACGSSLTAEVTVEAGEVPSPVSVILRGKISDAEKTALTEIIANDLNIPEEKQTWIGTP
jgi:hypothetical protein